MGSQVERRRFDPAASSLLNRGIKKRGRWPVAMERGTGHRGPIKKRGLCSVARDPLVEEPLHLEKVAGGRWPVASGRLEEEPRPLRTVDWSKTCD